jgi:dTDP-4-dehydrorhamnose reductase
MIAIVGASGQLGTAFRQALGDGALAVTRADLDLQELATIGPIVAGLAVDAVVNCAAYTAVDDAEEDEATARRVNADAVEALAAACRSSDRRFVTFSTDYVFDGDKDDPYVESDTPGPRSAYGRTKLEGERRALDANPDTLVVRTSWLMSGTHRSFASTMLRLVGEGPVRVVDDQKGHPTMVDDLAPAVLAALDAGATGVLHLANAGVTTWYGLARECAEIAGLDASHLTPCRTDDFPRPARRPRNSVLASERLSEFGLAPLPHYRPALEVAVHQLLATAS